MNLFGAAVYASLLVSAAPSDGAPRIPQIPFEKYKLPNGLEVILHQDHSTPIAGVNLWYHVGSKNERPGRTGFAHLFEHMMFQGTEHHDDDYFGPLQKAGGRLNGSTSQDRTNYWETVPSNYLELALWMEADRMGFLLPVMTQKRLDNQRDVVKNERRQSYENRPYGLAYEVILAAVYPPEHPYSWPTIGSMADVNAASRDDIADFFRRYYHPGNASLCIAGDFDAAHAKQLVAKYFGTLPAGPRVSKLKPWVPEMKSEQRIRMTDRVGLARVYMVWHTVPMFAADDAELEILADVLGGGKTSRLHRALVRDQQIAQDVQVFQHSQEIAGALMIVATARPGHTATELEKACLDQIARLRQSPPTAEEVARAVNRLEAHFVSSLEPISEFGGRADQLNRYNVLTGDPGYLTKDFARFAKVDAEGTLRVAGKYLGPNRLVLEISPGKSVTITPDPRTAAVAAREKLAKQAKPEAPAAVAKKPADSFDRSVMPGPGQEPRFALPPIAHRKLSNGMEVLVVENHELPVVNLNLVQRVGRSSDPAGQSGLAALMTATWDEGTTRRTAEQIAEELAGIGASLSVNSDWDTTAVRLFTLKRHLPTALDVYNDVIQHPSFPEKELQRQRNIALSRLVQVRDEPMQLAGIAAAAILFGPHHPYGQPTFGTPSALKSVTRQNLLAFYQTRIRPEQATLIAVGDVTADEITAELEKSLGTWKAAPGPASEPEFPARPAPQPTRIVLVDKPGAVQSVVSVGLICAERASPDYFPLVVMNSIFGGQFSSRLNMNLREDKGYTYGARTTLDWRVHGRGPLVASASVQTAVTAPALVEFLKEFGGMTGQRPVTDDELSFSKSLITRGYPATFETPSHVATQLETLVQYRLPDDYFNTVVPKVRAVTADEVLGVAKKYLDLEHLAVVIVGDSSQVEPALRKLPAGKNLTVFRFDEDFHLAPVAR